MLIDTSLLVDFFKDAHTALQEIIQDAEHAGTVLAISVVTVSELMYILAAFRGLEFARTSLRTVGAQVAVLPVDAEIAEKAGEFKFRYAAGGKKGLPMADALIAATAWRHQAELLTADPHFEKVKEIRVRSP